MTAIGAPFQKYDDILRHREHKDTEKNTLHVARSTRRRRAAGEACQPQTNDHWTVARSFVCGLRASRRGLRCRPPASSASVSQCLRGLSKSIRRRNYEILYLVRAGVLPVFCHERQTGRPQASGPGSPRVSLTGGGTRRRSRRQAGARCCPSDRCSRAWQKSGGSLPPDER